MTCPSPMTSFQLPTVLSDSKIRSFAKSEISKHEIIMSHLSSKNDDEAFFIVDLGELVTQFELWKTHLPKVKPFYAVKCCPEPLVIQTLAALGCGFDCASQKEMEDVLETGVPPSDIIYANTIKGVEHLKYALSKDVKMMTFDNEYELEKIKKHYPRASLVLRITADDSHSHYKFSTKFGCSISEAKLCLEKAKELELDVIGVSFHVGSMCSSPEGFESAIRDAGKVFEIAAALGMKMNLLDIGGGFPGDNKDSFVDMAQVINNSISRYFGSVEDLNIIAEPGRFFVTSACTLILNFIGKKKIIDGENEPRFHYFVNDTVFGSFINQMFEDHRLKWNVVGKKTDKLYMSTIFGHTNDSLDVIVQKEELPEVNIGDWCYLENFGAYTRGIWCTFNGFSSPKSIYVIRC